MPGAEGRLAGKVCIVTGAGSRTEGIGNGRATAVLFAREGARVVVNDLDEAAAALTAGMITEEGGTAEVHIGDLTVPEVAEEMVAVAVRAWGRLDVLHNNVGIEGAGTVVDTPVELWDRVMAVNVKTMFLACKHAVPAIAASGGGAITTISSISALRPRGLTSYSASKGAVIALTQAMAIDHAAAGIRVNCIVPGPVYTPNAYAGGMTPERREARRKASPLGREGTGWDIANAAVYLASDEARWVTGLVMPVDGGVSLASPPR